MKISFVAGVLMCVAGTAMANGIDREDLPAGTVAALPDKPKAAPRATARKAGRLPGGDLRQCLELQTDEAIIRCAEGRRSKRR